MFPAAVERWRPLASTAAARAGASQGVTVPIDLVLAVVLRESGGVPAIGDAGHSFGLMQVKDTTARELGVTDPRLLLDPTLGLLAGATYLATKLRQYGDIPRAVAAYNAGSARYDERERFVNQSYVDYVLGWFQRGGAASALPATPLPALAVLGGLALIIVAALASRAARGRAA